MQVKKISLEETNQFSTLFLDYINQKTALNPYFGLTPTLESFEKQLLHKQFSKIQRDTLYQVLTQQYESISMLDIEKYNIEAIKNENTYTVTCGHQLNIFTGPLYFVFKIISIINLAKQLKARYPTYHFVPVYWMASEDHDFEEINHFYLFGKKYEWQSNQKGAVGELPTSPMHELLDALPPEMSFYANSYQIHQNLSDATRELIHTLFGHEGLICLDPNHVDLKKQLIPIIKNELTYQHSFHLVNKTTNELQQLGYKEQVHPRECNFFWKENGIRTRIETTSSGFSIKISEEKLVELTLEKICSLAEIEPERFSPNVVLRPIYQEIILPNLSFTGGPAEIAYWLQLKSTFDHYNIEFPILLPRSFGLIVPELLSKKLNKYNIPAEVLFQEDKIIKKISFDAPKWLDFEKEKAEIKLLEQLLKEKVKVIDPSLIGYIGSEINKIEKITEEIEKRLIKSAEKKNEDAILQILNVKSKLFPLDGLQERHDNIFTFKLNHASIIDELLVLFEPLDFRFNIFYITT